MHQCKTKVDEMQELGCPIGFEVELRRRFEPCRGLDSRGQNCSASSFGTKECGTKELFRTQSITETFWVLAVALTKFEFAWLLFCCFEAFLHLYNFIFFTFQYIISKPPYLLRNTTYNMVGNLGKDKPKGPQQKCNCQICNEPNCSLTVLQNQQKWLIIIVGGGMLDGRAGKGVDSKLSNREVEGSSPMLRRHRFRLECVATTTCRF